LRHFVLYSTYFFNRHVGDQDCSQNIIGVFSAEADARAERASREAQIHDDNEVFSIECWEGVTRHGEIK